MNNSSVPKGSSAAQDQAPKGSSAAQDQTSKGSSAAQDRASKGSSAAQDRASKESSAAQDRASKAGTSSGRPHSFLMVCLGNICRSPLAEGILHDKARAAGLDWTVDSAGTNGYHIGEEPHHLSQKVARLKGIDISRQRARKFTANDFQHFDKIYAMAGDVVDQIRRIAGRQYDPAKVELLMNELHPGENEDVPDPYYGSESGYHDVYRMIEQAADRIIEKYRP